MQKLVQGIHHFQAHVFRTKRELFRELAQGQRPAALFITCADSRINPNLVTQTEPGDLFVIRNAGNIVPAFTASDGEAAAIELAIDGLGIRDVVVCGHSDCGAMKALLADDPTEAARLPAMASWLRHARRTEAIIRSEYAGLSGAARLTATVEENVLVQIDQLRTHPSVARALERNELRVHGWVYKIETGAVYSYDPGSGQFEALTPLADPRPVYPVAADGIALHSAEGGGDGPL
jgi:carbonic anhydrase